MIQIRIPGKIMTTEKDENEENLFHNYRTKYRYSHDFMKPGMKVKLVKEPDSACDAEAVKVMQWK